jgi:DNA primase
MGGTISKRTLEDIRFRNDIADVVGSYFRLQRAGASFKAVCPFHKEKTPSFHVNPQRQIYHCFGCGAGGDVFRFVMQYENVDFLTAAKLLAQRAGIALELDETGPDGSNKAALYDLHAGIAAFYHRVLTGSAAAERAREYLKARDLDDKTVEAFLIGYAPDRWDTALRWAEKHNIAPALLEQAGLVVRSDNPQRRRDVYDRFRDRLMFPIRDEQSRVIAFSGRILDNDRKEAKYVNSPETPLFQKGRVLYALDKARRPIADAREAIVCEGQIDVIRCHQAGFAHAVAGQGTAFTEDHVRALRRYTDSVVLVYDGDRAGQDAAVRTAGTLLAAGLAVRVVSLPADEDPDSFLRKRGADAFREAIAKARSAVAFQIAVLSAREDTRTEIGLMRVTKAVLATIAQTPNEVQKTHLVEEAASLLRLPPRAVEKELRHAEVANRQRPIAAASADEGPAPALPRPPEERLLCEHLLKTPDAAEVVDLVEAFLPLDMIRDRHCRLLIQAAIEKRRSGTEIQAFLADIEDRDGEMQRLAAAVQMAPERVVGRELSHADAVKDLILLVWKRELKRLRDEARQRAEETGERPDREAWRQLGRDMDLLQTWKEGSVVIQMHLAERRKT